MITLHASPFYSTFAYLMTRSGKRFPVYPTPASLKRIKRLHQTSWEMRDGNITATYMSRHSKRVWVQ